MPTLIPGQCGPSSLKYGFVALGNTLCIWLNVVVQEDPIQDGTVTITNLPSDVDIDSVDLPAGCTSTGTNTVHVPTGTATVTIRFKLCWTPQIIFEILSRTITVTCTGSQLSYSARLTGTCTGAALINFATSVTSILQFVFYVLLRPWRWFRRPMLPPSGQPRGRVLDQRERQA